MPKFDAKTQCDKLFNLNEWLLHLNNICMRQCNFFRTLVKQQIFMQIQGKKKIHMPTMQILFLRWSQHANRKENYAKI